MITSGSRDLIGFKSSTCHLLFIFFFFSSRRRHTRYIGDWSSDVCSSDLVLYILTYVLLVLFVLSWFWARYSLRLLVFHRIGASGRRDSVLRPSVGEIFEESLILDNGSILPKLWVQIVDGSTLPGHRAHSVVSIGGHKRAVWRARSTCRQRGQFQLGPVSAFSGDPFGLFRRRVFLQTSQEILVLPRLYPFTHFPLLHGGLPGRGRGSRR